MSSEETPNKYPYPPFPAYPGTQNNNPGFNITFPRADNYYSEFPETRTKGNTTTTVWTNKWNGTDILINHWPVVWEFQDEFINQTFQEPDPYYNNPSLAVFHHDPASGNTTAVSFRYIIQVDPYCKADLGFDHRPTNNTCNADVWSAYDYYAETKAVPGDGYFVALMNYTPSQFFYQPGQFHNFISVSELFSIKNSTKLDPKIPAWINRNSAAPPLPMASVVVLVLLLSSVFAAA